VFTTGPVADRVLVHAERPGRIAKAFATSRNAAEEATSQGSDSLSRLD
jgi:hypothetical protein